MFKVTLHAGDIKDACLHNTLGRLDFGYAKLNAVADYKAELFSNGIGSHGLRLLLDSPRWSASIWELIARLVALGLYTREVLPAMPSGPADSGAYAKRMCALVEHWADGEETRRARVGTAQVTMQGRRCDYVCELWDDLTAARTSQPFRHAPEVLQHWDLLARGVCWTDAGQVNVPARPPLKLAPVFEHDGQRYISLGKLRDPARSGLVAWMTRQDMPIRHLSDSPSGIVPEAVYATFMKSAL